MIKNQRKTTRRSESLCLLGIVGLVSLSSPANAFAPRSFPIGPVGQSRNMPIALRDERLGSLAASKAAAAKEQIASSLPTRKSKHRKRKKKSSRRPDPTKPVSQKDLAHHVACRYVTGPGGRLHKNRLKNNSPLPSPMVDPATEKQLKYLKRLERHPALVLNADYQPMSYLPLSVWNWQDAIKAVFSGKVTVVDTYPDVVIRPVDLEIPLPSVIALNEYVPQFNSIPAFTKRNVFLRDEYKCQYCNDHFHTQDLSLDHVLPRCRGGVLKWENAVTACKRCNGRKGSLPLDEIRSVGMKLVREPFVPTQYHLASVAGRMLPKRVHPTWAPYLQYTNDNNVKETYQLKNREMSDPEELFTDAL